MGVEQSSYKWQHPGEMLILCSFLHICKVRVVIYSLFVRVIVSVIEVMDFKSRKSCYESISSYCYHRVTENGWGLE